MVFISYVCYVEHFDNPQFNMNFSEYFYAPNSTAAFNISTYDFIYAF